MPTDMPLILAVSGYSSATIYEYQEGVFGSYFAVLSIVLTNLNVWWHEITKKTWKADEN